MEKKRFKDKVTELYRDLTYKYLIENKVKKGDKILVISTDGIGDFILREKILLEIIEKYGEENIYILVRSGVEELAESYKIPKENIIVFTNDERRKMKKSKVFLEKISCLGIKRMYLLDYTVSYLWFIKYFKDIEKIGFDDKSEISKFFNQSVERDMKNIENIAELTIKYIDVVFNKKYTLEEVRPHIGEKYKKNEKYKDAIAFGVGSSERRKMMSPRKQEELLIAISEKYPEREIYLLGTGQRETMLVNEMKRIKEVKNIIDLVGKTNLEECSERVNSCEVYIGMDSGLYNLAFGMGKKTIGLFSSKNHLFAHDGIGDVTVIDGKDGENEYFGDANINGIKKEEVLEVLNKYLSDLF